MKVNTFDFSVIVCCYNSDYEKLKKTLVSIIKQKDVSFEIIITDDGSTDRSIEQIKVWAEEQGIKDIKYNFLPKNVGTVQNIVSAVKIARGDYIKTISPGDYFFDEFSLKQYLTKFQTGQYKLLFSQAVYYTKGSTILKLYNPRASGTTSNLFMKKNVCQFADGFLGATFAGRKDSILPYFEKLVGVVRLLEDFPLTYLMLMNNEKVGFIRHNLVWYECDTGVSRVDGGSQVKADFLNFFNYLEKKYKDEKKTVNSIKFLRYLKNRNKAWFYLKYLLVKPSFLFYLIDRSLTTLVRKITYFFNHIDAAKLDKITTL